MRTKTVSKRRFLSLLLVALLLAAAAFPAFAEEDRTLIWQDEYTNVDTEDPAAPQSFDQASDHADLTVYANTNELFGRDTLTMILSPATKGYVTYDVSDVEFPAAQVEVDVAFYADPALITNYVTIWTSPDGKEFTQNSAKLLEDPTDMTQGWYLCKVINFAAIPEGTNYIRIQLETPGQGWDVQLYSTAVYEIPAGDINLVAPEITLNGSYPATAAKDSMIQILDASATDDVTAADQLEVSYTVTSPVDSQVTVTDGQFVLGMYGTYTVQYVCMDEHGNMAKQSYTIEAVDKSELEPEPSFPTTAVLAGAGAVVVLLVLVVVVIVLKRRKSH